ncbi:MAG: hypothetical protein RSD46_08185, partial [Oscillospiraceae bacterium]
TVTGALRMGYMAGQSEQINGNYNYPVYAMYLLTVNSLPSSVYGTYTVKADNKAIATDATGFNQYWVGKDATVTITGTQSFYANCTITYTMKTNQDGTTTYTDVKDVDMTFDRTATVTFTPVWFPAWTINSTVTGNANAGYTNVSNGNLIATGNKLDTNTVRSLEGKAD